MDRCDDQEQCVDINMCHRWCTKIETEGFSGMSFGDRDLFNKKICFSETSFNSEIPGICCDARNMRDRAVCGVGLDSTSPPSVAVRTPEDTVEELDPCGVVHAQGERCGGCDPVPHPGAWPWMSRLIYAENTNQPNTTLCGGALVSRRHVVTAAHCVLGQYGQPTEVVLGELDITREYDCVKTEDGCSADGVEGYKCFSDNNCAEKSVRYKVSSVIKHNSYSKSGARRRGSRNDVAVLVLDRPVDFSTFIQPVCLPSPHKPVRPRSSCSAPLVDVLVLTGWGNVAIGRGSPKPASLLQELRGLKETPLEGAAGCKTLLRSVTDLAESHMCVWKRGGQANGCTGDSGGPVARLRRDCIEEKGFWELAGVVSFGVTKSCGSDTPLVLTRIGEPGILSWLKGLVGRELPNPPEN